MYEGGGEPNCVVVVEVEDMFRLWLGDWCEDWCDEEEAEEEG